MVDVCTTRPNRPDPAPNSSSSTPADTVAVGQAQDDDVGATSQLGRPVHPRRAGRHPVRPGNVVGDHVVAGAHQVGGQHRAHAPEPHEPGDRRAGSWPRRPDVPRSATHGTGAMSAAVSRTRRARAVMAVGSDASTCGAWTPAGARAPPGTALVDVRRSCAGGGAAVDPGRGHGQHEEAAIASAERALARPHAPRRLGDEVGELGHRRIARTRASTYASPRIRRRMALAASSRSDGSIARSSCRSRARRARDETVLRAQNDILTSIGEALTVPRRCRRRIRRSGQHRRLDALHRSSTSVRRTERRSGAVECELRGAGAASRRLQRRLGGCMDATRGLSKSTAFIIGVVVAVLMAVAGAASGAPGRGGPPGLTKHAEKNTASARASASPEEESESDETEGADGPLRAVRRGPHGSGRVGERRSVPGRGTRQAAALPAAAGAWSEVTNQPYNSDAVGYRDPVLVEQQRRRRPGLGSHDRDRQRRERRLRRRGRRWRVEVDRQGRALDADLRPAEPPVDRGDRDRPGRPLASGWAPARRTRAFENYTGDGIYRSGDGGQTWQLVGNHLDNSLVSRITFDGVGIVYAATEQRTRPAQRVGPHQRMDDRPEARPQPDRLAVPHVVDERRQGAARHPGQVRRGRPRLARRNAAPTRFVQRLLRVDDRRRGRVLAAGEDPGHQGRRSAGSRSTTAPSGATL